MRKLRNDFIHGRWDVDPVSLALINVVASSDLSQQQIISFSVDELETLAAKVSELHKSLNKLVARGEL